MFIYQHILPPSDKLVFVRVQTPHQTITTTSPTSSAIIPNILRSQKSAANNQMPGMITGPVLAIFVFALPGGVFFASALAARILDPENNMLWIPTGFSVGFIFLLFSLATAIHYRNDRFFHSQTRRLEKLFQDLKRKFRACT